VHFAAKMGFRTVAINRGRDGEALVRKLGADEYIDSNEGSAGEALARLGGATVAISTVGSSPAQVDLIQGLKPNGRLVVIASDHQPLQFPAASLVSARRLVARLVQRSCEGQRGNDGFCYPQKCAADGRTPSIGRSGDYVPEYE
jgi:D-arabinose 1-dehydrogenase-like Zn-dependent alcohol dehydrogenase